jgi:hypothetical protein
LTTKLCWTNEDYVQRVNNNWMIGVNAYPWSVTGNQRVLCNLGRVTSGISSAALSAGLSPHLAQGLEERILVINAQFIRDISRFLRSIGRILSYPNLISHFGKPGAGKFPLAMHVPQLQASSHNGTSDKSSRNKNERLVKPYLPVFILLLAALIFGLLPLHFAKAGINDGDPRFVVNLLRFIICSVVAQLFASFAGIEWAARCWRQ